MCTLIIARHCLPGIPVVLAANRDEMLERPWSGPRIWPGTPKVLAPRDDTAGGTWLGISEGGFMVAVTNRIGEPQQPGRKSRGLLCLEVLGASCLSEARRVLEGGLREQAYNGFNMLVADRNEGWLYSAGEAGVEAQELGRGMHLVTSRHDLNPPMLETLRMRAEAVAVQAVAGADVEGDWVRGITPLLSDPHEYDDGYAVCKHGSLYGTKSASIVTLRDHGRGSFWFCAGRPCEAPLVSQESLA